MSAAPDPQLVAVLGGECSGKTTLAVALAEALDAVVVPEQLRQFVDDHGRVPRAEEQAGVLAAQIEAEQEAVARARAPGRRWVIGDPAALMTAVYSVAYYDDMSLIADAVAHQDQYRLTVWCDPAFPWQPDGDQRDGPEHRQAVHELIAGIVAAHRLPVLEVSGSPSQRLDHVLAELAAVRDAASRRGG